jgi:hypothetical protein
VRKKKIRQNGRVEAEYTIARAADVGAKPRGGEVVPGHIPRGLEVLIKKAAVDPAFKKMLLEKRAGAAEAIALKLEAAEAAMLEAVPGAQLKAIVANTKVNPSLRPAFLGYAGSVMLAALGTATACGGADVSPDVTRGIEPDIPVATDPAETAATAGVSLSLETSVKGEKSGYGMISGIVTDNEGNPIPNALVAVVGANRFAVTNADGYYSITPVAAGVVTVEAFSTEYGSIERTDVKILAGLTTNLTFQYTNPSLEVPLEPRIKHSPSYQGIRPDLPGEGDN